MGKMSTWEVTYLEKGKRKKIRTQADTPFQPDTSYSRQVMWCCAWHNRRSIRQNASR